jgi:predicted O-methyltransferase YrrM
MLKNRIELAKHLASLGFTKGAEIGVYEGRFSEILFQTISNLEMVCVDSWDRIPHHEAIYAAALARLKPYKATVIRKTSVEAAPQIPDGSLDFVYIDASHEYSQVKDDIEVWTPKVRQSGIVAGDDYYITKQRNTGVIRAVNEYVDSHGYDLHLTRWDLEIKPRDDQQPNWWFVK